MAYGVGGSHRGPQGLKHKKRLVLDMVLVWEEDQDCKRSPSLAVKILVFTE